MATNDIPVLSESFRRKSEADFVRFVTPIINKPKPTAASSPEDKKVKSNDA